MIWYDDSTHEKKDHDLVGRMACENKNLRVE